MRSMLQLLLATENQQLINKFAELGSNLGISSQIANDIQGITRGNDITKRKITLPVIYALLSAARRIQGATISRLPGPPHPPRGFALSGSHPPTHLPAQSGH